MSRQIALTSQEFTRIWALAAARHAAQPHRPVTDFLAAATTEYLRAVDMLRDEGVPGAYRGLPFRLCISARDGGGREFAIIVDPPELKPQTENQGHADPASPGGKPFLKLLD